jgi:signal transduction histidine kinase
MITDEQLARLLSLISHEVRGPVGVMRGYLRLLDQQAGSLSDTQRHAITAGLRAGDRIEEILAQLSVLARLQRGEGLPGFKPVPIGPLLHAVAASVILPSDPVVTVHVAEIPPVSIRADEGLLRTALGGLTTAVVRAQAAAAKVYLLAQEDREHGNGDLKITITTMEAVSGARTEAPLDVSRGGLGLDLALAAFIVDAHNGRSVERRSATRLTAMVVWLPLA